MTRTIMLSVDVEDDEQVAHVVEVLARHLAGLVLDGIDARLMAYQAEDEAVES